MIDDTDRITLQIVVLGWIQMTIAAFLTVWIAYVLYTLITYSNLIKVR